MVRFRAGPTWTSGSVREQPDWDAHAEFVDALIERGTFVMGGPFSDDSGSMSLLEGIDADEAGHDPDPQAEPAYAASGDEAHRQTQKCQQRDLAEIQLQTAETCQRVDSKMFEASIQKFMLR
jgi:uncharacterized protein YciI